MTNKYHRQGYRIGGILKLGKKLFAKQHLKEKINYQNLLKKREEPEEFPPTLVAINILSASSKTS